MKNSANDYQVGGEHYRKNGADIQHWDYATMKKFDMFQYQITKYVERWRDKNGIIDLEKARHFLDKYIEVEKSKIAMQEILTPLGSAFPDRLSGIEQKHPFGYSEEKENGK